ncbi:MAG: hypothetical protein MRJ93_11640 [Nitrososphaeraceae archaeon]|nr:hypothetical protein [Nitrososphaeraceae archaeon]
MDLKRSQELKEQLKTILAQYDAVVYFKAGSNKLYYQCIEIACQELNLKFISFGNRCMEGIGYVDKVLDLCEKQRFLEISNLIKR